MPFLKILLYCLDTAPVGSQFVGKHSGTGSRPVFNSF